jgi:hypothetical protein
MTSHDIPELDRSGLRRFGLTTGIIVVLLFGGFFPWLFDKALPVWPWVIFGILGALAIVTPSWLRPVYKGWMRFGLALSRITTPIIMGVVFFLLVTPVGWLRKVLAEDPMARQFDDSASYRVASEAIRDDNLSKPY